MARRTKPVAAHVADQPVAHATPQQIVAQVAESMQLPGDAAEPAQPADTSFTPHEPSARKPHMVWARVDGSADKPIGIKLETEQERKPGMLHQRVLIRFRDDLLPTADEKAKLKAEGFKFCPDVQSWGMQKSAANQVLALRTVNDLLKGRGHQGQSLYV